MEFKTIQNETIGESLLFGTHKSGLKVYIMRKVGFKTSYAVFGTDYGSVDSKFKAPSDTEITHVPDGIAHFLEHKLFEQPDGSNAFDSFSQTGASANAFTSFNMTAYLFSCTDKFEQNLETLIKYVQDPYFTDENVKKEQGIIGQEIKMYDDNAYWRVFFGFLNCLYNNHPVKLDIAGTVESISKITKELLYKCYNTFYHPSNMALFLTGDFDTNTANEVIENSLKKMEAYSQKIQHLYPEEEASIANDYSAIRLSVAMPMFMMGYKDIDNDKNGKALLKKDTELDILMNMLFGKSSSFYETMYRDGLINDGFSFEYNGGQKEYGFSTLSCESKDPKAVFEYMKKYVEETRANGLLKSDFDRIYKLIWGRYIRSFDNHEDFANSFIAYQFSDVDLFSDFEKIYHEINFESVSERFLNHFDNSRVALSVVNPI